MRPLWNESRRWQSSLKCKGHLVTTGSPECAGTKKIYRQIYFGTKILWQTFLLSVHFFFRYISFIPSCLFQMKIKDSTSRENKNKKMSSLRISFLFLGLKIFFILIQISNTKIIFFYIYFEENICWMIYFSPRVLHIIKSLMIFNFF